MNDDPRVDAIWESLAPHIEWARGFSLILLFAHHPAPVEQIRARLEASLQDRDLGLQVIEPRDHEDTEALTLAVLAKPAPDCGALWLPLWWGDDDRSRRLLLGWLNERRFLLERDVTRPLVLVLPSEYRSKIANVAPDLWVVRNFSEQLPSPEVEFVSLRERGGETHEVFVSQPPGPAEVEWLRMTSASDQRGLAIEDGLLAFQSARERGRLGDARRIAMEMLMLVVRGRVDGDALVADVGELLAGAESLDSRAQRNLSIALHRLGEVESEAGNLAVARELYGRALGVSEALANADPHSARAQRDLSVSYGKVGDVEAEAGNLEGARDVYRRALAIREALANTDPHNAQAQRDLSVAYDKVGNAEAEAGNLIGARDLYRRSLEVSEALAKADPHNAQAQRDLSIAYDNVGDVEGRVGNLIGARDLTRRSLAIREALAKADSPNATARFDVALALSHLASIAAQAGEIIEYRDYLRRANAILDDLDANGQLRGHAKRESIRESIQTQLAALELADKPSA